MVLGLTNSLARKTPLAIAPRPQSIRPLGLSPLNARHITPKLSSQSNLSLQSNAPSQRLMQLNAIPPNHDETTNNIEEHNTETDKKSTEPSKPYINEKGIEILDSTHLGQFITEDGYPLDVYMDKAVADLDLSKMENIYTLKYSLDHDDRNGHRTLQISDHFPTNDSFYGKIMRDTIYGQWMNIDGEPTLDLSMHVNDNPEGKGPVWETSARNSDIIPDPLAKELAKIGGEMRKKIFQDHVQDALQAMAIGTKAAVEGLPELVNAPTRLRYLSDLPSVAETQDSGRLSEHLNKPILDKKSGIAQITGNIKVWGDAMNSSTRATRQLMNAMLRPETLGPLLKNPKTVVPTLALLLAMGIIAAHNQSSNSP